MVAQYTTPIPSVEEVEEIFPLITMSEGEPGPGEEENPRNTDPPPAGQTEPSTPPDPGGGGSEEEEGDIKPGDDGMHDNTL